VELLLLHQPCHLLHLVVHAEIIQVQGSADLGESLIKGLLRAARAPLQLLQSRLQSLFLITLGGAVHIRRPCFAEELPERQAKAAGPFDIRSFLGGGHQHGDPLCRLFSAASHYLGVLNMISALPLEMVVLLRPHKIPYTRPQSEPRPHAQACWV